MPRDPRELQFDFLVKELNSERAATLGRAGRKIEAALAECDDARRAGAADTRQAERYQAAYTRYLAAHQELCLYREALGLLDHRRVDEVYPPPAPL